MSSPYSRNTFEEFSKVRHYVSVRLKQGVPLVDADVNEMEDIRRHEIRNFLRWFIGNGVPVDNDGFRIVPSPNPDDVVIRGGDGTYAGAGRCLVDGMEVLNEVDVAFSLQEFADPLRAAAAGVPAVTLPSAPVGAERTDVYYLHVWEREITSAEPGHGDIVDSRIGVESARRIRREWAVRVAGEAAGVPPDDTPAGHRYYPLARVVRTPGQDVIAAQSIHDLRRRGVTLAPRTHLDQVALDAFGPGYPLVGDGLPRLPMSLRDVINAILRDGRPAVVGPRTFRTGDGPYSFPASAVDSNGHQWVFWFGAAEPPAPGAARVFFQRQVGDGVWADPAVAFPASGNSRQGAAAVASDDGSIWFFYGDRVGGIRRILGRRFEAGAWSDEFNVSEPATNNNLFPAAAVDENGDIMVVWRRDNLVVTRRFVGGVAEAEQTAATAAEPVPGAVAVVPGAAGAFHLYAVEQGAGPNRTVRRKTWQAGGWDASYSPATELTAGTQLEFAAIRDRFGGDWLIWATNVTAETTALRARRIFQLEVSDVLQWVTGVPRFPTLLRDATGNLQVFFRSDPELAQIHVIYEV